MRLKDFFISLFNEKNQIDKWLFALFIVGFLLFSYLAMPDRKLGEAPVFNSPDESANYLFANNFIHTGKFIYDDIFAVASGGYILPRSMQVVFSRVTPTAFIGQPLIFGAIGKIIGQAWVPLLTPLFMAVALIVLYSSIYVNYGKKYSWLIIALLTINPVWLYSATRPMMTTGLFISFVLLALAFFLLSINYQRSVFYALSGGFFGLALLVRISEAVWLIPLAIILLIFYRRKIYWLGLIVSFLCVVPAFALIGTYNYKHFASPWQFGYNNVSVAVNSSFIKTMLFPFGVDLLKAWQHFYSYIIAMFPLWSVITIVAIIYLVYCLYKYNKKEYWLYFALAVSLIGYLIIYYGSWTFFDNPKQVASIGSSYIRYFLPITLLSAPLIAHSLISIKSRKIFISASLLILIILASSNYYSVWLGADEGVVAMKKTLAEYKIVRERILQQTPPGSIIIAGRMDKVIYPYRRVYSTQVDWQIVGKYMGPRVPVYLLSKELSQEEFLSKQNEIKIYGLEVKSGIKLTNNFYIYQIIKSNESFK